MMAHIHQKEEEVVSVTGSGIRRADEDEAENEKTEDAEETEDSEEDKEERISTVQAGEQPS